jgi:hypothetical protein
MRPGVAGVASASAIAPVDALDDGQYHHPGGATHCMRLRGHAPRLGVVLAGCAGFCIAAATAFGYAKLNAWRDYGENFQLGYIVGYLDGVNLAQHHDERAIVPTGGRPQYARWRDMVNEFYADPANASRPIPDAMAVVGAKIREEVFEKWRLRREQPVPSPSPHASAAP